MDLVLVDTSVWVNFFKGRETPASSYLRRNLANILIATCPVITQEVLQGIPDDKEFGRMKAFFSTFINLPATNAYLLAVQAANIYRDLRKKGVTVRKPNDCLITAYALNNSVLLLHDDQDFANIARHTALNQVTLS
jgi:predicted nucleic acid-binding protein